jgi:uncharacterized protein (DUF111 family)
MKVLFLDCFSGISGDMTVGALCDLGVKPSTLEWELSKLEIGDFHMHFQREQRHHLEGVAFSIHEGATHTHDQNHGHDHEDCCGHDHDHGHGHSHSHGEGEHEHGHSHSHEDEHSHEHGHAHEHPHEPAKYAANAEKPHAHDHDHGKEVHSHAHTHDDEHKHGHSHEHGHTHEHGHGEGHHHHEHEHVHGRNHRDIRELIEKSELSGFVKKHALSIFQRIAVAEGKIHGQDPADVGFHEVGALDSIADIICVCAGIEALGIEKVYVSALHDGRGHVDCAHGRFPLPAPATLEILTGVPIGQIDEPHELITPTGAAIVAEFGVQFGLMPALKVEKVGYGIGSRKLTSRPNVLRAVVGEMAS